MSVTALKKCAYVRKNALREEQNTYFHFFEQVASIFCEICELLLLIYEFIILPGYLNSVQVQHLSLRYRHISI